MESLNSPLLTGNLKSIKQKLFQVFPQKQRNEVSNLRKRIMIGDNARNTVISNYTTPAQQISEDISTALLQRNYLEIEYQSEAKDITTRVIEVQYILLNWPVWYILAWDHLRSAPRIFRIDRIKNTRIVEGNFQLRAKDVFTSSLVPLDQTI